jgi:hypothetical protein
MSISTNYLSQELNFLLADQKNEFHKFIKDEMELSPSAWELEGYK